MQRYFLHIAYNGTHYHGWQVQPNAVTVQEVLTDALRTFLQLPELEVVGCGRTDTGVHARQYYAHFDGPLALAEDFVYRINKMLPKAIVIYEVQEVHFDAHARFDATSRTYQYHIHQQKDPFLTGSSAAVYYDLNVEDMNAAAHLLIGKQDFTSFSKVDTNAHTNICELTEARWEKHGHQLTFTISANRFLRNMVRAVVGTLVDVGRGKMSVKEFEAVIRAKDRGAAGTSAAACGLYLTNIVYPYIPTHV